MGFPISMTVPAAFTAPLPAKADVVVIGGGVIGVMSAWQLAQRGLRVVLCEKGRVAGEQSSRNWGWVRQQGRDAAELPLMIEARQMWQTLAADCGEDLGYRETGVLYIANKPKDVARFEAFMALARQHALDTRMLTPDQVLAMLPGANPNWPGGLLGGLWTASDGRAEPWQAVPAMARAAVRAGVTIIEDCAVRSLDVTAGRVTGVVTEQGRIACDHAVLAGGAWSALFLGNLGLRIPQLSVLSTVAQTPPMPEIFPGGATDNTFAFRRRIDGGYSIAHYEFHEFFIGPDAFRNFRAFLPELRGSLFDRSYRPAAPAGYPDAWRTPRRWSPDAASPFEAMRILDPKPSKGALKIVQDRFASAFPALGRPEIACAWAGMIDTMPDVVPVIDHAAALPGLVVATGMCGHGFGIGPAVGRVVADLVTGRAPGHDLARFRMTRFGG